MQPAEQLPEARDEELDASDFGGPLEWYWNFSQRGDFETDTEQLQVLEALQRLFEELEDYRQYRQGKLNRLVTNLGAGRKPPRGMYIHGGVGRGKSLMMDAFYKVSRHRRKRRVHFHEFMREIHGRMRALSGQEDPLDAISTEIAKELRLLAFDEFHVSDIDDAMTKASFAENGAIEVGGRAIAYRRRAKGVIWFDFHELFEKPRSQVDYLEIASQYHTVLISGVRRMLPSQVDVVRRFTWLVDVFYDQRVKLALSADVPAEDLVAPSPEATGAEAMVHKEFARTASRLREMQSRDYFGKKHASAANPSVMVK